MGGGGLRDSFPPVRTKHFYFNFAFKHFAVDFLKSIKNLQITIMNNLVFFDGLSFLCIECLTKLMYFQPGHIVEV